MLFSQTETFNYLKMLGFELVSESHTAIKLICRSRDQSDFHIDLIHALDRINGEPGGGFFRKVYTHTWSVSGFTHFEVIIIPHSEYTCEQLDCLICDRIRSHDGYHAVYSIRSLSDYLRAHTSRS